MRKSFIIFLITLLICVGSIAAVNYIFLNENNNVSITETVLYGNQADAEGLTIETNCCSNSHIFWKNNYTISKDSQSITDYDYSYEKVTNNKNEDVYLSFNPMNSSSNSEYSNLYKYSQIYNSSNNSSVLYVKPDTSNNRIIMVTSENGLGYLVIMNSETNEVIQKLQIITAESPSDYFGISNLYIYDNFIVVLDTKSIITLVGLNAETNEYSLILKTEGVFNKKYESPFNELSGFAWNGEKLAAVAYDKQYYQGNNTYFLDSKCSFLVYVFNNQGTLIYNGSYYNNLDFENIDFQKDDGSEMIYSSSNKFYRCRPVKNQPISVNWN